MLTGKAKKDYQREYMQKRRSNKAGLTGSNKGSNKPLKPTKKNTVIPVMPSVTHPVASSKEIDKILKGAQTATGSVQYVESAIHRALAGTVHKGVAQVQGEESLAFRVLQSTIHKKE